MPQAVDGGERQGDDVALRQPPLDYTHPDVTRRDPGEPEPGC